MLLFIAELHGFFLLLASEERHFTPYESAADFSLVFYRSTRFWVYTHTERLESMKSVLHEASSILKAIEKAWEASGKPSEFNVKVLEQAETKFLFFTSRPAIVSISFDPRHVPRTNNHQQNNVNTNNRRPSQQHGNSNTTQDKLLSGTSMPQFDSVSRNNPRSRQYQQRQPAPQSGQPQQRAQQPQRAPQPAQSQTQQTNAPAQPARAPQPPRQQDQQITGWTPELAQFVSQELNGLLHIMGIGITFQEKIELKTLTITFAQPPLDNKEDARLLYISLSYLLIQLTKKQEKKKLRDFHLVITAA